MEKLIKKIEELDNNSFTIANISQIYDSIAKELHVSMGELYSISRLIY